MHEWERFKVGNPSTLTKWTESSCQRLDSVHHVTHIRSAVRILNEGRIRSGLVYDKSKLNTHRIQVVWLSPNDWHGAGGFRYGSVRFSFPLAAALSGRHYYWVESIPYSPQAVRFLITDRDYSAILEPYDPESDEGPWWLDSESGIHYWNGRYCLEIMLEGDLCLTLASRVDTVKHHPKRCNIVGPGCPDCGLESCRATERLLATIVGLQVPPAGLRWVVGGAAEDQLQIGWSWLRQTLLNRIDDCDFVRTARFPDRSANAIGRAMLAAYSRGNMCDLNGLAAMAPSKEAAVESCGRVIAEHFGLIDWTELEA